MWSVVLTGDVGRGAVGWGSTSVGRAMGVIASVGVAVKVGNRVSSGTVVATAVDWVSTVVGEG